MLPFKEQKTTVPCFIFLCWAMPRTGINVNNLAHYLFICDSFNDAFSSSDYIASDHRMINE